MIVAMTKPGGRPAKPPVGKNPGPMKPGKGKPSGGLKNPLPGRGTFGAVGMKPVGGKPAPGKKPMPGPGKGR